MKEFNRVRQRILWRDGDFRMVRYLVIYGHGDGSWEAPYWSDPTMYWEVQECAERWPDGECEKKLRLFTSFTDWVTLWDVSRIPGWYRDDYLYADRTERGRITRRNAKLGKEWLKRHKRLLASQKWKIKCDSIDGEGTLCPLCERSEQAKQSFHIQSTRKVLCNKLVHIWTFRKPWWSRMPWYL